MDEKKYIHGIIFKKDSNLDMITYKAKLNIFKIHRYVTFSFSYKLSNNAANSALVSFSINFNKYFTQINKLLLEDAAQQIKMKQISREPEIINLLTIEKPELIFNYLTYNEIELTTEKSIISVRSEWEYEYISKIMITDQGAYLVRNEKNIDDLNLVSLDSFINLDKTL